MVLEVMERIYSGHWFLQSYNCGGFVHDFHRFAGKKFFTKFAGVMDAGTCLMYWDDKEFEKNANYLADKLMNDDGWRESNYALFDDYSEAYFSAGERFRNLPFHKLSDEDLAIEIRMMIPLQQYHQLLGVLLNGFPIDGKNHLSDKIRNELKENVKEKEKFDEYWSFLTLPTNLSLRQKKDFEIAKIVEKIKKNDKQDIKEEIKNLWSKYCWLDYLYLGPPAPLEQYQNELNEALKDNKYLNLEKELAERRLMQEKLTDKLGFGRRAKFLIELAKQVIWQKGWRKDYQAHGFWCYEPFFRELAKRKKADKWQTITFLFPWEIERFILENTPTVKELVERRKFSVFVDNDESTNIYFGGEARNIYKKLNLQESTPEARETRGHCAYGGYAKGRAKIIHVPEDMQKMEKGDILISQATSPDLLLATAKASAIVTNTGGLICHAAIISRELKIPCVVGTGNATLIFKDGDLVEVDATNGVVRKIS